MIKNRRPGKCNTPLNTRIKCVVTPLNLIPPLSGHAGISPTTRIRTFLYKSEHRSRGRQRHSHKRYRSLVISLRLRGATQQNATHSRTNRQARHLSARRRCGSSSVSEVTHSVYKYALNKRIKFTKNTSRSNFLYSRMYRGFRRLSYFRTPKLRL